MLAANVSVKELESAPDKPSSPLRWVVLMFTCVMLFCSYYAFDIPSAIKPQMNEYFGRPTDYEIQFNLLYTLYAAPNVVLPFIGGYLVDYVGVRACLVLYCCLVCIGQLIFTLGLQFESWPIMFFGRLVFGFGGESYGVAVSSLLTGWFKGKELAMAFGIYFAFAKCGTVINNIVSPRLGEDVGLVFASWFGLILCGVSLLAVLLVIPIDYAFDQSIHKYHVLQHRKEHESARKSQALASAESGAATATVTEEEEEDDFSEEEHHPATFQDIVHLPNVFWVLIISMVAVYGCLVPFNSISMSLLLERDYFIAPDSSCHLADIYQCQSATNVPVNCPASTWYQPPLPANATISGVDYSPLQVADIDCSSSDWSDGCMHEYCSRQTAAQDQASVAMSIPYIIIAGASPLAGYLVDHFGQRAVICFLAPLLLIIVHALLGYSDVSAVGPLIGQGFAYTAYAAVIWPAIPLVVDEHITGLGFGIATATANLSCAIVPLIVAGIYSNSNKYIPQVETLFIILAACGTVVGLYMNYFDAVYGDHVLNASSPTVHSADEDDVALALSKENMEKLDHSRSKSKSGDAADAAEKGIALVNLASGSTDRSNKNVSWVGEVPESRGRGVSLASQEERDIVVAVENDAYLTGEGEGYDTSSKKAVMASNESGRRRRASSAARRRAGSSGTRPRGASFTVYGELYRGGGLRANASTSMSSKENGSSRSRKKSAAVEALKEDAV